MVVFYCIDPVLYIKQLIFIESLHTVYPYVKHVGESNEMKTDILKKLELAENCVASIQSLGIILSIENGAALLYQIFEEKDPLYARQRKMTHCLFTLRSKSLFGHI